MKPDQYLILAAIMACIIFAMDLNIPLAVAFGVSYIIVIFITLLTPYRFALDDFGSGLSSFAYLKNLPVDYLKIDGMFVRDIVDDPMDHAMVKSINEIGQVMGMQTIAEFVENDEIKGMLREIGVNYAQGYGIDKPMPFDDLLARSANVTEINLKNGGNVL